MTRPPLTAEEFAAALNVSRETLDRLRVYLGLLETWQRRVNLVGASTLGDPWRRHFLDSGQLFPLLTPSACRILDVGSGAGFPGLVLAILGIPEVHLVESDQKKSAFLREASRLTKAPVTVHNCRIESLCPFKVDVVTSRACASMDRLLAWTAPFLDLGAEGLFLKGQSVQEELTQASTKWKMQMDLVPSRSNDGGVIVRIGDLHRVEGFPTHSTDVHPS